MKEKTENNQLKIDELLGEVTAPTRFSIWKVDPRLLVVDEGYNVRTDMGDIEELCDSIIENGIQTPLKCYKERGVERYHIISGHRRYNAIMLAISKGFPFARVPMISIDPKSEQEKTFDLLSDNSGKPLTMSESSEVIKRLINFNFTIAEISKKTGMNRNKINQLIEISKLNPETIREIDKGNVAATSVLDVVKEKGIDAGQELVKKSVGAKNKTSKNKRVSKKEILQSDTNKKTLAEYVSEVTTKCLDYMIGNKIMIPIIYAINEEQYLRIENTNNDNIVIYIGNNDNSEISIGYFTEETAYKLKSFVKFFLNK